MEVSGLGIGDIVGTPQQDFAKRAWPNAQDSIRSAVSIGKTRAGADHSRQ